MQDMASDVMTNYDITSDMYIYVQYRHVTMPLELPEVLQLES